MCDACCRFQSQYNSRKKMIEKSQLDYNYVQNNVVQTGFST